MAEETETKKKISSTQVFWIRFALWVIFAVIVPVVFIIWRFDLFGSSHPSIGGWGIIAIIIVVVFIIVLIKYVRAGMKYSMLTQCLNGLCKVILPLVAILLIVYCIRDSVDNFLIVLGITIVSELIAIPINPMPKWINDNKKEAGEEAVDTVLNKYFEKKKQNENNEE